MNVFQEVILGEGFVIRSRSSSGLGLAGGCRLWVFGIYLDGGEFIEHI
jgi:hypothetical protein